MADDLFVYLILYWLSHWFFTCSVFVLMAHKLWEHSTVIFIAVSHSNAVPIINYRSYIMLTLEPNMSCSVFFGTVNVYLGHFPLIYLFIYLKTAHFPPKRIRYLLWEATANKEQLRRLNIFNFGRCQENHLNTCKKSKKLYNSSSDSYPSHSI